MDSFPDRIIRSTSLSGSGKCALRRMCLLRIRDLGSEGPRHATAARPSEHHRTGHRSHRQDRRLHAQPKWPAARSQVIWREYETPGGSCSATNAQRSKRNGKSRLNCFARNGKGACVDLASGIQREIHEFTSDGFVGTPCVGSWFASEQAKGDGRRFPRETDNFSDCISLYEGISRLGFGTAFAQKVAVTPPSTARICPVM